MNSGDEKKQSDREFTYQVGWKRGRIRLENRIEKREAGSNRNWHMPKDHPASGEETNMQSGLHRIVWKALPRLPRLLILPLLWVIPVTCFISTMILIYFIMSSINP